MPDIDDILKWMKLVDKTNEAEVISEAKAPEDPKLKMNQDIEKHDGKIMQMKLDKLNMLVRKKYIDGGSATPEEKMFQFHFQDKGDYYEFHMPLNILFGRQTQEFCAKYWDSFFKQAGIDVTFDNNIKDSLRQAGNISLVMKLNKNLTKEVG